MVRRGGASIARFPETKPAAALVLLQSGADPAGSRHARKLVESLAAGDGNRWLPAVPAKPAGMARRAAVVGRFTAGRICLPPALRLLA
ncbi:MAG: hypothetical protein V4789_07985, partial [Burkholderia gladioli]